MSDATNCDAAADEIERLEAENKRLREEIRILENEVSDLRAFAKLAQDNAKVVLGQR